MKFIKCAIFYDEVQKHGNYSAAQRVCRVSNIHQNCNDLPCLMHPGKSLQRK